MENGAGKRSEIQGYNNDRKQETQVFPMEDIKPLSTEYAGDTRDIKATTKTV